MLFCKFLAYIGKKQTIPSIEVEISSARISVEAYKVLLKENRDPRESS